MPQNQTSPILLLFKLNMTVNNSKLTFCEFFFGTGQDIQDIIFESCSMGALACFGQTNHKCQESVQDYLYI